jgi:hypothetical protein
MALIDRVTKKSAKLQCGAMGLGLLILLTGCHSKANRSKYGAASDARLNTSQSTLGRLAVIGRDTITTECEHESYANASKGLIVEEAGLHEDVFSLRDRASLTPNAYNLNEALRLETLLHTEAKVSTHSAEQADCIDEFAEHLGGLTDTLVQADQVQKEMDISAFKDASKQAEDQLEKKQHEADLPTAPSPH